MKIILIYSIFVFISKLFLLFLLCSTTFVVTFYLICNHARIYNNTHVYNNVRNLLFKNFLLFTLFNILHN